MAFYSNFAIDAQGNLRFRTQGNSYVVIGFQRQTIEVYPLAEKAAPEYDFPDIEF